jgi:hypothetical protein
MVNVVQARFSSILPEGEKRALVVRDENGLYDAERHVSYDQNGATFYWSETSIQADFPSTVALAEDWARRRKATVYICQ